MKTRRHPRVLANEPHWVYRIYDVDDNLLYVGCTVLAPGERVKALRHDNATVARAPIDHWVAHQYEDMNTALAVEGLWIDQCDPPLNGMRSGVAVRRAESFGSLVPIASEVSA